MSTNGPSPLGTDGKVADLGFSAYQASGGTIAYHGDLEIGGEFNDSNNHCIWLDSDGYQFLLAREGLSPVPDIDGVIFANVSPTAVNNNSQVAMLGLLAVGPGGVNVGNSVGIWRMSPTQSKLIVRRQAGEVGGLSNASYSALGEPTMNDLGAIAFRGELAPSAEVNEANRYGIWLDYYLDTLPSNHIVALAGRPPVGLSSARFANFGDPLVNDNFRVLFTATLDPLIGGVSARDAQGIWSMWGQEGALLARTGSGGVPGVPGANFAGFGATALNNNDLAAVEATLAVGIGGVTSESAKGLWLMNPHGASTLVARTGDTLAGRTIADLTFTGGSGGSDGRPRSLNDSNQLIFTAQFTNGDEGVFLFTPSTELAPADFTGDGLVNAADLQRWRTNFGASPSALRSQGDADSDGDVDGSDLLTWQRQLGPGASASPVPEPGFIAVVLPGGMLGILRLNCGARSARRFRHR